MNRAGNDGPLAGQVAADGHRVRPGFRPEPPQAQRARPLLIDHARQCSEGALATRPLLPPLPNRLQEGPAEFFAEGPKPPPGLRVVGLPVGARLARPVEVAARTAFELRRGGQAHDRLGPLLDGARRVAEGARCPKNAGACRCRRPPSHRGDSASVTLVFTLEATAADRGPFCTAWGQENSSSTRARSSRGSGTGRGCS